MLPVTGWSKEPELARPARLSLGDVSLGVAAGAVPLCALLDEGDPEFGLEGIRGILGSIRFISVLTLGVGLL